MLAAEQRLRRSGDFSAVVRAGGRAGRGGLVVHMFSSPDRDAAPSRAGFVVPRSVGSAVTRNRVRRRLRHLVRHRLATLPPGTDVVIRVLPSAARESYEQLGFDLDSALGAARRRVRQGGRPERELPQQAGRQPAAEGR